MKIEKNMPFQAVPAAVEQRYQALVERVHAMKHHRVFAMITSRQRLRTFMEWHVFAVWDFMSLAKRLQIDFTHTALPWLPPANPTAARLINEIILDEETDKALADGHASHFELYLVAMREVGASTAAIDRFIDLLRRDTPVELALRMVQAPAPVASFVQSTIGTACDGQTGQVLGSFFYGREDPIPQMFQCLLDNWAIDPQDAPTFVYYLVRHIELDTDRHGPAAKTIIAATLGDDGDAWLAMFDAAQTAIEERIRLWDALAAALDPDHC